MEEKGINQFLERLGLTEYESKVLYALFKAKETEAPEISRLAQVPKTRVYDVLDRLIGKKLVIEIRGRPKKYRVVEANEAVSELIQRKKTEVSELEIKAEEVKSRLSLLGIETESEGERVMKVKDKKDFERILGQEIEKAKKSVLGFAEISKGQHFLSNALKKARGNKAEVKMLGVIPKELSRISTEFMEAGIDLKHCDHGINAFLIDSKKVVLALSDFKKDQPEYHFTIWNNNPALSNALGLYFSDCWNKGKTPQRN